VLLTGALLWPAAAAAWGTPGIAAAADRWIGTWEAAPQKMSPGDLPPGNRLADSTLRQVVHVSLGGACLRMRFSNRFGDGPLVLNAVAAARSAAAGAVVAGSVRRVTFGGSPSVTIPAGACKYSDPIEFPLAPLSDLAVTVRFEKTPDAITGHPGARCMSYLVAGDAVTSAEVPSAVRMAHWYVLSGVDIAWDGPNAAVVVLGDSITDGRGSTTDGNGRWTDFLARRFQANASTTRIGVLNAGIGGNRVLHDGLGPSALSRLDRDVLDQSGARWLIVLEGVNDIGTGPADEPGVAAIGHQLIAAYEQLIDRTRARHIRIYGATILPFGGSAYFTPDREAARQTVNRWIRTSGRFDGVVDFDAAVRDAADSTRLRATVDCGDHLHLSDRGYRIMAEAVDLGLFAE
jgi:lysophospholipase L1-like esterase